MAYTEDVSIQLNVLAGAMGGITAITSGMSALTSTFGEFGTQAVDNFGAVEGLLVSATALVATFGVQAAEAFGEFEQGMKIAQTVSGQTGYAIQSLSNQANQLSITYRTAIGDITEGLQTLGRAGLNSAETQLDVLESGLQTAKLEGRNLNGVLEELIQNTAMLGGDLKSVDFGEQSEYLNTLMVGTSMTAPIDSHDISQTLQYAGGTAAAAGANLDNKEKLEDLMGTVAAFAQKGVTGSMAGTALRAFFTKPASQDASVTNALSSIGLSPESLWENGGNSMKSVSDQIGIIQRRMDALHLSTMDQVELWGKIVGPKMGQQMMKLDSSSIKELTRDIQSASSAQDLATQTLDTYNQKVSEMNQQGQLAYREFGEKAAMFLTPIVEILTAIMKIASNKWVNLGIFVGAMALINHGIQAAWGMVKSIFAQIKGLFADTQQAMHRLAGSTDTFSDGLSQSANRAEVLNAKLHETDSTLQSIQAKALGINGMGWTPNGGVDKKVDKGVVASSRSDVFVGGQHGKFNVGEDGRIYDRQDKAKIREDLLDQEKQNKEMREQYSQMQKGIRNQINELEENLGNVNNAIRRNNSIMETGINRANELTGGRRTSVDGALRAVSATKKNYLAEINSNEDVRKQYQVMEEEYNTTKEEILSVRALKKARDDLRLELENEYREAKANKKREINKYIEERNEKYPDPDDERHITKTQGYKAESLRKFREEFESENASRYEALVNMDKDLSSAKNKKILKIKDSQIPKDLQELENAYAEVVNLEEQLKTMKNQNLSGLTKDLEKMRSDLANQLQYSLKGIMSEAEIKEAFPTFGKGELKNIMKDFEDELQAEILVKTKDQYDRAMMVLKERAMNGDELARRNFEKNLEADSAGVNRLDNPNYKQFYRESPVITSQNESNFVGTMMKQSKEASNEFADAYARATAIANKEFQGGLTNKLKDIRGKLHEKSDSSIASYDKKFSTVGSGLNSLGQSIRFAITGLESAQPKVAAAVQQMGAELTGAGMKFNAIVSELALQTGLTEAQINKILLSSEMLDGDIGKVIASMMASTEVINMETSSRELLIENLTKEAKETNVANVIGSGTKEVGGFRGALKSVVGFMGGPLMAGMMAVTTAMQIYQELQQQWQERMNKAQEAVSESKDRVSKASDSIKELYSSENQNLSEGDLEKIIDAQYAHNVRLNDLGSEEDKSNIDKLYVNNVETHDNLKWTDEDIKNNVIKSPEDLEAIDETAELVGLEDEENISALRENTIALEAATAAYSESIKKQAKEFDDPLFGSDGIFTRATDGRGPKGFEEFGGILTSFLAVKNYENNSIIDGSPVLSASQSSKDYAGSTELAAIFAENSRLYKDFSKDTESILRTFGKDTEQILHLMQQLDINAFNGLVAQTKYFGSMTPEKSSLAQMYFKENKTDFQQLGKLMFRYEQSHGFDPSRTAYSDAPYIRQFRKSFAKGQNQMISITDKKKGKDTANAMKKVKLRTTDRDLIRKLESLMGITRGQLSEQNLLAMGSLQQLQDMHTVAKEQVAPGIIQTVQGVYSNVLSTNTVGSNTGSTSEGMFSAANNTAAIAAILGAQATDAAVDLAYDEYSSSPKEGLFEQTLSKEDFRRELFTKGSSINNAYGDKFLQALAGTSYSVDNPDATPDQVRQGAEDRVNEVKRQMDQYGTGMRAAVDTVLRPLVSYAQNATAAAYDRSPIGEYGSNSSGGSGGGGSGGGGSGGSGGSGNSDKNYSKKERVDLVLCNKKEIPKLNVNLFKKPPNFTVLNKNFKLRDIKINSQDKPKSILNAVKNGLIETQKRMDPKIIQDEEGSYNPVEATEGRNTPSGTARTTT